MNKLFLLALLAVTASAATPCTDDIDKAAIAVGKTVEGVLLAIKDCPGGGDALPACLTDVANITADLGDATDEINKAIGDCGSTSSQCVDDLSKILKDLSLIIADGEKALIDCPAGSVTKCGDDVALLAKGIVQAVFAITGALKDCGL